MHKLYRSYFKMRCSSYCTAKEYDIPGLVQNLINNGHEPQYFDDVVHVKREFNEPDNLIDIFYFPFGCTVIWGSSELNDKLLLDELENWQIGAVDPYTFSTIYYQYNQSEKKSYIDEEQNKIILGDHTTFVKLSMAHALAQSVKLEILERSVTKLLQKTDPLQQELARKGTVALPKKEISKQIGILFNERYSINLHSDILDTPEFFWRRPSYEPLYLMTAEFEDIQVRQNILNHRLDMIHELYSMLSNELNYKHSTRLEWIIIILIAIEVLIGLQKFDFWQNFLNLLGIL